MTILASLPAVPPEIVSLYQALVTRLDNDMAQHIRLHFPQKLQCTKGCSSCCISFSVLPIEAAHILMNNQESEGRACQQEPTDAAPQQPCTFLNRGCCTIYSLRPIICRTQGLPLGYVDEEAETIEVSCCPRNFGEDEELTCEQLFFMDSYNDELSRLNEMYCTACRLDPMQRIALSELL